MYVNEERKHKGIECKLCRKLCSLFFFLVACVVIVKKKDCQRESAVRVRWK